MVELPAFLSDFPIFVVASDIVIARAVELIQRQAGLCSRAMHAEHKVVESVRPVWLDGEGLSRAAIQNDVITVPLTP